MSEPHDDEVWFNGKGEKLRATILFGQPIIENEAGQVTKEDPGALDTYLESVPIGTNFELQAT